MTKFFDKFSLSELKTKIEVPKDKNAFYSNDSLTNRDIIPIPSDRRIIYGVMAVIMGWIGSHHHIGFPLIARMTYGIKGATFGIIFRIITGIIWWGVQAFYGGQAIRVCLGALSPSFLKWDTFHNKNDITSRDLVGMILYCVFMTPCLRIPPEKLQFYFKIVNVVTISCFLGMLGYSTNRAHGVGTMFKHGSDSFPNSGALAWAVIKGIFSVVGNTGTGILGQSDFTRYSKGKHSPVLAQLIGAPVAITFSSLIGIITTSAARDIIGTASDGSVVWNPVVLLSELQEHEHNTSGARACVFFAVH
ncbi:unnamed protein product [Ambrosiozyma monospora]|uniref:Unnamed protein product n=1 Tax=Ambrosiozyma monospora TaxID=43982 RepID=A0A9W6Z3P4_AMBMO|nr:unnamed protein product [Ambrosiozyma monospora]